MFKGVVCLAALLAASACATRGSVRPAEVSKPSAGRKQPPVDSLETFMGKVRAASARPLASNETIEGSDPALAASLSTVRTSPTAASHRLVAGEYVRLGILDKAHEHLTAAVGLDPRDAGAWDGIARIWRDWGFANLGLADAYRAIDLAPTSPVVHNTLGTLFQALGRLPEAREQYENALRLDSGAAYAWNNLCYGLVLEAQPVKAANACRQALRLRPDLEPALNNLALAYGAVGNVAAAEYILELTGKSGRAQYNLGIVQMARKQYPEAVKAFEAAQTLRPGFRAAALMARVAREHATTRSNP